MSRYVVGGGGGKSFLSSSALTLTLALPLAGRGLDAAALPFSVLTLVVVVPGSALTGGMTVDYNGGRERG